MKNWPKRYSWSLKLFIFWIVIIVLYFVLLHFNLTNDSGGSFAGLFYIMPLPFALLGYFAGVIADATPEKVKQSKASNYIKIAIVVVIFVYLLNILFHALV